MKKAIIIIAIIVVIGVAGYLIYLKMKKAPATTPPITDGSTTAPVAVTPVVPSVTQQLTSTTPVSADSSTPTAMSINTTFGYPPDYVITQDFASAIDAISGTSNTTTKSSVFGTGSTIAKIVYREKVINVFKAANMAPTIANLQANASFIKKNM